MSRYDDAGAHFRRALNILETAVGSGHPNVAFVLNDLALLRVAEGQYSEAEPLYACALTIREKTLDP